MHNLLPIFASYVPPALVKRAIQTPVIPSQPTSERFPAAILFADVVGFTPLTEALSRKEAEGPEELTRLLNHYFNRIISVLEAEGGQVIKFGGDSITVLFPALTEPLGHAVRRASQAAAAIQTAMAEITAIETSVGPVKLRISMGIGAGDVASLQIGGIRNRWEVLLSGQALQQAVKAEKQASHGEVHSSPNAMTVIAPNRLPSRPLMPPDYDTLPDPSAVINRLRCFVPGAILAWLDQGLHEWLADIRPMTVMFVKVSGIEPNQPDLVAILHPLVRRLQSTVYHYEGTLNRLSIEEKGMMFLLLFGAPPFAHEDDAERAVHCALDLQGTLPENTAVPGLQLAIGITTGKVFAGPVGGNTRREYTVMADSVNLAARLMSLAGPGKIFTDYETYRQANAHFRFEILPPIRVKGKANLVNVYRPQQHQAAEKTVQRGTQLVGRNAEVSRLQAGIDRINEGQGSILVIEGEAGIGKSRLVAELIKSAQEQGLAVQLAAGQSIEQRSPNRAWRDLLRAFFGLDEAMDTVKQAQIITEVVMDLVPDQVQRLPLLNDILGLGIAENELTQSLDPSLRQQSLGLFLPALLHTYAQEQPLILVLEDAHWLDSSSWELTAQIARSLSFSNAAFFLVLVTRPLDTKSNSARHIASLSALDKTEFLKLDTLSPQQIVTLVANQLQLAQENIPDHLKDLVVERSSGNPFYAEELIHTLHDEAVFRIEPNQETGRAEIRFLKALAETTATLPETLHGLILARIDRLPPQRQLILKVAAVIGRSFSLPPLSYLLGQHTIIPDIALKQHLEAFEALDLMFLDQLEPELTYIYKHIITQEVAYQSLLHSQRRQLHQTAVRWYEQSKDDLKPYYPLLVYHSHHAQDDGNELRYARLAGEQAAAEFANDEAVAYFSRALALLPEEERKARYELLLAREACYHEQGTRDLQADDLAALNDLCRHLEASQQVTIALRQSRFAEATGDYARACEAARSAVTKAQAVGDKNGEAIGYHLWGTALWRQANLQDAKQQFERGAQLAETSNNLQAVIDCLKGLGLVDWELGDFEQARAHYLQALAISNQIDSRQGKGHLLNNLGILASTQGDSGGARSYFEQSLAISREIGDRRGESRALNNLGIGADIQGDYASAQAYYEQALHLFREIGDREGEDKTLNNLGEMARSVGDLQSALTYQEQALIIIREIGDRLGESKTLNYLGSVSRTQGKFTQAQHYFEQALAISEEIGNREGEAISHHGLAGNFLVQENLERAETHYKRALRIRRELKLSQKAVEDRAGLAAVALARGDLKTAKVEIEPVFDHLAENMMLEDAEFDMEITLICIRVLLAAEDDRAEGILKKAQAVLQERTAKMDDDARRNFLNNVPEHRQIVALWRAREDLTAKPSIL